jgi:prophage regulatory protein
MTAQASTAPRSRRLMRLKEVLGLVPLSRSTIYARMAAGTFPRSYDLGGGVVAWYEADVLGWIDSLPEVNQPEGEK